MIAAVAQASRSYFGSDDFGYTVTYEPGSSGIKPGMTPASQVTIEIPTWTDFVEQCKDARVLGGVHFRPSVDVAPLLGEPIADLVYDFVMSHINGQVD